MPHGTNKKEPIGFGSFFVVYEEKMGLERAEKATTQCVVARPGEIAPLMGEALRARARSKSHRPHRVRIKRTRKKTLSSFYLGQEILSIKIL